MRAVHLMNHGEFTGYSVQSHLFFSWLLVTGCWLSGCWLLVFSVIGGCEKLVIDFFFEDEHEDDKEDENQWA
jgi:hypothetical protein